ncbi:MAG: dienelactone hydrolase family protein, partial [Clostridia bacterium]|nr:dienelactone hydrolase family protein [Clostridia bacterium]
CPVADLNGAMRKNYVDYQGVEKEGKMKGSVDALFISNSQIKYYNQLSGTVSEYAKQKATEKEHLYFTEIGARFAARLVICGLYAQGVSWARDLSDAENRTSYADKIPGTESGTTYGVFMDGMEYNGLPTQVFAYVGLPEGASAENPVPAMVLTHGAAGHAYQDWVQHWNNRGYAAISFYWREPDSKYDNTMPDGTALQYTAGPRRSDIDDSVLKGEKEDQFMYHATSDISLAYNLLNQMPEVQKGQIGLTGISWGGIISSRGLGEDTRFKLAMPIYGCGNLDIGIGTIHPTSVWDGKHTFPNAVEAGMPVFWVNGSNDTFFSLNAMAKSVQDTNGDALILLGSAHGQGHGAGMTGEMNEIFAYADYYLKGEGSLPKISGTSLSGRTVTFNVTAENGIEKARLI